MGGKSNITCVDLFSWLLDFTSTGSMAQWSIKTRVNFVVDQFFVVNEPKDQFVCDP